MNSRQRRKARRLYDRAFGTHVDYYMAIPISKTFDVTDEENDDDGYCQNCGDYYSFSDGTAGVTASGDVYCRDCARAMDEEQEEMDAEDSPWDFYPEPWYDARSGVSEVEPEDTPRIKFIGEGSEYPSEVSDDAED
jgi:hypothetical protein